MAAVYSMQHLGFCLIEIPDYAEMKLFWSWNQKVIQWSRCASILPPVIEQWDLLGRSLLSFVLFYLWTIHRNLSALLSYRINVLCFSDMQGFWYAACKAREARHRCTRRGVWLLLNLREFFILCISFGEGRISLSINDSVRKQGHIYISFAYCK